MAIDSISSAMARQAARPLYAVQTQAQKQAEKQEQEQKTDQNTAIRPSYDEYIPSGNKPESLSGGASETDTGTGGGHPDSGDGVPAKGAPVSGIPANGSPAADISAKGSPEADAPAADAAPSGIPADGSPAADAARGPKEGAHGPGKPEEGEKCTANTDRVDAEIEALKKKKQQLEQQITGAADDPDKKQKLEKELRAVEQELKLKDNDSYRKQHATFING